MITANHSLTRTLYVAFIVVFLSAVASADVPHKMSYQGRLTDSLGNPIDTVVDLDFGIYNSVQAIAPAWSETQPAVTVTNGLFNVMLGSVTPIPAGIFEGSTKYLAVAFAGHLVSAPRMQINSAAYAYRSLYADTAAYALDGAGGGGSNGWVDDGAVVHTISGGDRVGIGTTAPSENLVVGGGDLGGYEGAYVVVANSDWDNYSGFKLGWNADNHATIDWYGDGDQMRFGTRSGGTNYNFTMVMRQGMVGINNDYPQEPLMIGPSLGAAYGDMISICNNGASNKYSGIMFGEDTQNKGTIIWYNGGNEMRLQTESNDTAYGSTLVLKGGKVGIGNNDPGEPLVVGDGIGSFNGNRITIGDNTAGAQVGLVCGESELSRGWLLWDISGNYMALGMKDAGTSYNDLMVLEDGTVGIGDNYSTAKLHVESAYDIALGVTRYGTFNNVISSGAGTTLGLHSHVHQQQNFNLPEHALIVGVDGYATASNPGCSTSVGVRGESWGGRKSYGVQALVNTHLNYGCGIYAYAMAQEYWSAVLDGPVDMPSETFQSGAFTRIDHPLDPENKYLQHALIESSEMLNVYSGNAVLNDRGEAVVELPDWFQAVNRDLRYQLTCIGGYAPVYIAEKVADNRFRIAGGVPGLEVSWQVTGVRSDPYAETSRQPVELDKRLEERGYYRHPKAYNLAETDGINYQRHRSNSREVEPSAR